MATKTRAKSKRARRAPGGGALTIPPAAEVEPGQFGLGGIGQDIPIEAIDPGEQNPRGDYDKHSLSELADSIRSSGVLQPLIVQPCSVPIGAEAKVPRRYAIVAGERRWRAARLAGLDRVPCIVRELSDEQARRICLIENLQREDLNAIEVARGLSEILDRDDQLTQRELARQLGKSQSWIANHLRLLELPACWTAAVIAREITERHARAALAWVDHPRVLEVLYQKTKNALSAGDPVTVEVFEDELIPEVVRALSRPMDSPDGLIWDAKRARRVPVFQPTAKEAKELEIVEVGGERRALATERWDELQAAFLAVHDVDHGTLGRPSPGEAIPAGADTDGDEDLDATSGDGIPSLDRSSPAAGDARSPGHPINPLRPDPFLADLWAWKLSWMRWLIARALRHHQGQHATVQLAVLALGDWDCGGWMPDAEELIQARVGKRGWKDSGVGVWKLDERQPLDVLDELLADPFWRPEHGEIGVVPAEQLPRIMEALDVDLEVQWSLEQAGELSEAYWRLHSDAQLDFLGRELGIDLSGDAAETYDDAIALLLARKPTPDDTAAEQGAKALPYPKELKRLKKAPE